MGRNDTRNLKGNFSLHRIFLKWILLTYFTTEYIFEQTFNSINYILGMIFKKLTKHIKTIKRITFVEPFLQTS